MFLLLPSLGFLAFSATWKDSVQHPNMSHKLICSALKDSKADFKSTSSGEWGVPHSSSPMFLKSLSSLSLKLHLCPPWTVLPDGMRSCLPVIVGHCPFASARNIYEKSWVRTHWPANRNSTLDGGSLAKYFPLPHTQNSAEQGSWWSSKH